MRRLRVPRIRRGLVAAPVIIVLAAAVLLSSRVQAVVPPAQDAASPPKLLVILVMDQFWAGYIDLYRSQWTRGLKRIADDGAFFTNAYFTHGLSVTCPGHATIGTGATPNRHGMIANTWYDKTLKRSVNCVDDPEAVSMPFGGIEGRERHSAKNLLVPTFADELRRQTAATRPAKTVSVALKPRSAIMLGGRPGPNTVVVWEEDHGAWATSKAYTNELWPDVEAFVRSRPMAADYGAVWSLFLPPSAYRFVDDGVGEARPTPWGRTFPHTLHSLNSRPDIGFVSAWERSPWSDAFVADLAAHLVHTRKLGTETGTDLLTVSMPALDIVGHEYGPHSLEVQDLLVRSDQAIGRLLDAIERNVGPNGYLLAFSADHGVATLSERLIAQKKDAGRISTTDFSAAVRAALNKTLGEGSYVGLIDAGQVMLMDGVLEKLRAAPNGFETLKQAMAGVKGIARVYGPGGSRGHGPHDRRVPAGVAPELRPGPHRFVRRRREERLDVQVGPRHHARHLQRQGPPRAGDLLRRRRQEGPLHRAGQSRRHRGHLRRRGRRPDAAPRRSFARH